MAERTAAATASTRVSMGSVDAPPGTTVCQPASCATSRQCAASLASMTTSAGFFAGVCARPRLQASRLIMLHASADSMRQFLNVFSLLVVGKGENVAAVLLQVAAQLLRQLHQLRRILAVFGQFLFEEFIALQFAAGQLDLRFGRRLGWRFGWLLRLGQA